MPLSQKRVLVVDNADAVRLAFERHLREAGCQATTTWSGLEALGLLKSNRFDILLVDDYLADLHVGEFLKQVTRLRGRPRVLVMQAKPTQKDIRFHGTVGTWPLVDKTDIDELIHALGPNLPNG